MLLGRYLLKEKLGLYRVRKEGLQCSLHCAEPSFFGRLRLLAVGVKEIFFLHKLLSLITGRNKGKQLIKKFKQVHNSTIQIFCEKLFFGTIMFFKIPIRSGGRFKRLDP